MRVFVAFDIENYNIISKISRVKETISMLKVPVKIVEDENLHVTLLFIGEIPENQVERLRDSLSSIRFISIKIRLKGMGVFPSIRRPRVVWIGIEGDIERLRSLQKLVEESARKAGVNFKTMGIYKPHLTIARVKGHMNIDSLIKFVSSLNEEDFGEEIITKVKLKQSILTRKGPIYKDLLIVKAGETG